MPDPGKFSALIKKSIVSVNDTLDDMLNESGDEEEGDHIINQVLDEIGIEMSGKVMHFLWFYYKFRLLSIFSHNNYGNILLKFYAILKWSFILLRTF